MVELSGADRAAAERGEKGKSAGSSVRRRTEEGERVGPAPPAAGGTSAAAAGNTGESSRRVGPPHLRLEGPVRWRQRPGLSGGVVRTDPLRRRLEGPVRRRRTSLSGLAAEASSLHRRLEVPVRWR